MQKFKFPSRSVIVQIFVVIVLCVGSILLLSMLGVFEPQATSRTIVLRVEASGGYALITMEAGSEKITQTTTVTTPWERRVTVPKGASVFLTASNPTQTGQLSCTILMDRQVWKKETTSAPKDGVACAGIVP